MTQQSVIEYRRSKWVETHWHTDNQYDTQSLRTIQYGVAHYCWWKFSLVYYVWFFFFPQDLVYYLVAAHEARLSIIILQLQTFW